MLAHKIILASQPTESLTLSPLTGELQQCYQTQPVQHRRAKVRTVAETTVHTRGCDGIRNGHCYPRRPCPVFSKFRLVFQNGWQCKYLDITFRDCTVHQISNGLFLFMFIPLATYRGQGLNSGTCRYNEDSGVYATEPQELVVTRISVGLLRPFMRVRLWRKKWRSTVSV